LPPFIIISGQGDDAAVIAALQLGAVNYIAKREGYLNQLVYTIDQAIAQHRLNRANQQLHTELTERKRVEAALRENEVQLHMAMNELRQREETILKQATHDELTGLPNRRLFYDRLTMAISEARRYDRKVAAIFVDLDHFKEINDTLGHQAGDKFLVAIAGQIRTVPREIDTCARLGGDEFALVLSNVENKDQVGMVTRRILDALDREFIIDGASLHASASIGVAIFPDDADDADILLKRADMAMYRSKEAGRNSCHFWDKHMDSARHANPTSDTTKSKP
jgi:diguanylate cyclase (GGDEF)-like protein